MNALPAVKVQVGHRNIGAKLFRDDDNPIYVMDDGRFAVRRGDQWVVRPTVKGIEAVLAGTSKFIEVFEQSTSTSVSRDINPTIHRIVKFLDNDRYVDPNGRKLYAGRWSDLYLNDPKLVAQLRDLEKKRVKYEREVNLELDRILRKAVRVNRENLQEMKEKHGGVKTTKKAGD